MDNVIAKARKAICGALSGLLTLAFVAVLVFVSVAQCWSRPFGSSAMSGSDIAISEPDARLDGDRLIVSAVSDAFYARGRMDEFDLVIARSNELNAASFGNGRFLFWEATAELPLAQLEALAAHEVAHDELLHSLRAQDAAALVAFFAEVLSVLGGADQRGAANIRYWLDSAILPRYSRSQELQADEHAVLLLRRMGHDDPEGALAALLEELLRRYGDTGGGFTDTHPATSERIARVKGLSVETGERYR